MSATSDVLSAVFPGFAQSSVGQYVFSRQLVVGKSQVWIIGMLAADSRTQWLRLSVSHTHFPCTETSKSSAKLRHWLSSGEFPANPWLQRIALIMIQHGHHRRYSLDRRAHLACGPQRRSRESLHHHRLGLLRGCRRYLICICVPSQLSAHLWISRYAHTGSMEYRYSHQYRPKCGCKPDHGSSWVFCIRKCLASLWTAGNVG